VTVTSLPQPLEGFVRTDGELSRISAGRLVGVWSGAAVATIAVAVLTGWALDLPSIERVWPSLITMNPMTALCFLLAALSLILRTAEPLPTSAIFLSRGCAGMVTLAGVLVVGRALTPWDTGVDLVLFRERLVEAGHPTRMASAAAFNFFFTGLGLLLLDVRTRRGARPAVPLALAAALPAMLVAMGHVYGSDGLFGFGRFVSTALSTAVSFLLLAVGIIAARPASGVYSLITRSTPGGLLARRLLPAAVVLPLLLGGIVFKGQQLGLFDAAGGAALLATVIMLIMAALIWRSAVWLDTTDDARGRAERQLCELNEDLEGRVVERTRELGRINEALLDQTRFLHQVLDTSPQLVYVKDWAGRFTLANQAMADLYGTTVDGMIGKTEADFVTCGDDPRESVDEDRAVMTERRVRVITEQPAMDERTGAVRWFHTIKAPLVGRDGICGRVLCLSTDITARHYAEAELRRASDELRALFDASPLAICGLTADGYVRTWNRAAEELFGWSAGEVVGRPLPNIPPQMPDQHRGIREHVASSRPVTNVETHRMRKDREIIAVSVSTAPLHDAAGDLSGIVVVYGDIRERKELEAQLRQAQKMEAVGQLAGGVAHDFNNLLTVIRTASELLLADCKPGDTRRQDIEDIEEAAARAATLTRQLLAFSRQQVLEPRVVDLNQVVAELEPMARRLVQENIAVETRLAPDLQRITADRHQLDQVILNLVVNARDAMPDGGTIVVETSNVVLDADFPRTHPSARSGPHVMLRVTDTGCGMDGATRARIFEPFFTTKPVGVGTGLGLATVYGIVKQSGGHIWVDSEVGRGSSFTIHLPVSTATEDEAQPVKPKQPAPPAPRPDARILVVEDDAAVRNAVCRVLERRGYAVMQSHNGEQALTALASVSETVDLVISDIVMPEMSGLELRDRLRVMRPTVPVLLMSGYSQEAITRLGNRESLGPLIEKPFTVDALLENVRSVLHG
jgi:PAS domain S-box-containing protein